MKLLLHLAPHKTNYELIPTRNIVFNFNTSGFEVLEKYNQTKNYCFDDLGVEPIGSHYAKECNVLGELLLSRYDFYVWCWVHSGFWFIETFYSFFACPKNESKKDTFSQEFLPCRTILKSSRHCVPDFEAFKDIFFRKRVF